MYPQADKALRNLAFCLFLTNLLLLSVSRRPPGPDGECSASHLLRVRVCAHVCRLVMRRAFYRPPQCSPSAVSFTNWQRFLLFLPPPLPPNGFAQATALVLLGFGGHCPGDTTLNTMQRCHCSHTLRASQSQNLRAQSLREKTRQT